MKKLISAALALILAFSLTLPAAAEAKDAQSAYDSAASYCEKNAGNLGYGSEWLMVALTRGGTALSDKQLNAYCSSVTETLKASKGVLSTNKYTEYSRVILSLTAAGFNAQSVGSFDLTYPLSDFDKTVLQGLNGPVWALIALDSGRYDLEENTGAATQATREKYVSYILSHALPGGGWALSGSSADPDMTAMTLCALSKYTAQAKVKLAVEAALDALSALQADDGGFLSAGIANSESCTQVLLALSELGISLDDARFVKNGNTVLNALLRYQLSDGSFAHLRSGKADSLATAQALLALADLKRLSGGQVSLFRMVTFSDISGHTAQNKIEALANAGLISGMGGGLFAPDKTMTRAEFCAIVVKSLGLESKTTDAFIDVPSTQWYSGFIGAAYAAGVVKGSSETTFTPNGTITDVEARIMLARAGTLLGLSGKTPESWYSSTILIKRYEVASEVYALLHEAGRL